MIYMKTLSVSLVISGDHYILHSKDQRCGASMFVCVVSMNKLVHKQSSCLWFLNALTLMVIIRNTFLVSCGFFFFQVRFILRFPTSFRVTSLILGLRNFMLFYDNTSNVIYRNGHRFQPSNISSHNASIFMHEHVWHKSIKIYGIHTK